MVQNAGWSALGISTGGVGRRGGKLKAGRGGEGRKQDQAGEEVGLSTVSVEASANLSRTEAEIALEKCSELG